MKIADVKTGQKVRLTVDRKRFANPLDLAYLLRQTPHSRDIPPIDGAEFWVGNIFDRVPKEESLIDLHEIKPYGMGPKAYLAYAHELTLVED